MRKALLPIFLMALVIAACASAQPKIVLEADHFDFGELVNGVVVTKELTIRNQGDAPLKIEAVSTSCGCTTATLDQRTIAPGRSAILRIVYDSGAHGPDLTGAITRQVFITSNDPDRPEFIVEFDSIILPSQSS